MKNLTKYLCCLLLTAFCCYQSISAQCNINAIPDFPTEACSGDVIDFCIPVDDVTRGLNLDAEVDFGDGNGPVPFLAVGVDNGNGELCASITAPINETCAVFNVSITAVNSLTCDDGADYTVLGFLPAATTINGQTPIDVPIYPSTFTVIEVAPECDGAAGSATLVSVDGSTCDGPVAGTAGVCTGTDGVLDYTFDEQFAGTACAQGPFANTITTVCDAAACAPPVCNGEVDYPDIEVCQVAGATEATFTPITCSATPEVDNGDGTLTIISFDIYAPDAATGTLLGSSFESTTFGLSVCDPLTITLPDNLGCAPLLYSFEIVTAINVVNSADGSFVSFENDPNCTSEMMTATQYPILTATVIDDGSTCGTAQVDLLAEDVALAACATETLTCVMNGDELMADFAVSAGVMDPAGCSTLTATATCSGCIAACVATAPVISTMDATTICTSDGVDEPIDVATDVPGLAGMTAWIITDAAGLILGTPAAPPFVLDGAGVGVCSIWQIDHDGTLTGNVAGNTVADLMGCFELSNSIDVTRNEATASMISTMDATTICTSDGVDEPIDVAIDMAGTGGSTDWIITDAAGLILGTPAAPPFVLDGAGVGVCSIWLIDHDGSLSGNMAGNMVSDLMGCFALSNSIDVTRNEATASTISTMDMTTICADDGVADPINVTVDAPGVGTTTGWIITDAAGVILGLPAGPPFDLEGAGGGVCSIYQVTSESLTGDMVGANIADLMGCFALSNSIDVTRNTGCAVCPNVGDACDDMDPCTGDGVLEDNGMGDGGCNCAPGDPIDDISGIDFMEIEGNCDDGVMIVLPAGYTCDFEYIMGTFMGTTGVTAADGVVTYPAALADGDSGTVELTVTSPCMQTTTFTVNFGCFTCAPDNGSWD